MKFKSLIAFLFLFLCPTLFAQGTRVNANNQINWSGPRPWIDITSYGASGSARSTTANCVSSVARLTLASAIDFQNGQGLSIAGCGPAPSVTTPAAGVANIGSAGSTAYAYGVACVDAFGGDSGYGSLDVTTSTGNATLSGTNYNAIYVTPETGCRGYTLVGRSGGGTTLLQYLPWEDPTSYTGTASRTGNSTTVTITSVGVFTMSTVVKAFVTLTGCSDSSFNGSFPVNSITMPLVFNFAQTASNSSATGCTITVNPTFFDFGTTFPSVDGPGFLVSGATATNDYFVAKILSGGGTTTVNLSTAPSVNASGQTVRHDDTAAIQAAITASNTAGNSPQLYCPSGQYYITSDFSVNAGFNFTGGSYTQGTSPSCWLRQLSPGADYFRAGANGASSGNKFSNFTMSGGRYGIHSVLPGGMQSVYMDGLEFQSFVGFRATANVILAKISNSTCETGDWCIDTSFAADYQGLKLDTVDFLGTGNNSWHEIRIPSLGAPSTGFTCDSCLFEGPTGPWIFESNTPISGHIVLGNMGVIIFKNLQVADYGMTGTLPWLQTLNSVNGDPQSIEFDGGNASSEGDSCLINIMSNGTSNLTPIIFNASNFGGGTGGIICPTNFFPGSTYPSGVQNNNGTFTPALSALNLVNFVNGNASAEKFATGANCAGVGTSASPSVASCGSAAAGHFSCATNATGATCRVNTTAVTANSEIFVFESDTAVTGTALGVTCNTSTDVLPTSLLLASSIAATSFTINLGTVTTNPACFSYQIIN